MTAYYRDYFVVLKEVLSDSRLQGVLSTGFGMLVDPDGSRAFEGLHTGVLAEGWQHIVNDKFPGRGVTACAGIGYSDTTVLGKGQSAYLMYICPSCLPDRMRQYSWAWCLAAWIPSVDREACAKVRGDDGPFSKKFRKVEIPNVVLETMFTLFQEQTKEPLLVLWGGNQ